MSSDKKYVLGSPCCGHDILCSCIEYDEDSILVKSPTCLSIINAGILIIIYLLTGLVATCLSSLIIGCCIFVIEYYSDITNGICYKRPFFSSCFLFTFDIIAVILVICVCVYTCYVCIKRLRAKIQNEIIEADKVNFTQIQEVDDADNSCAIPQDNSQNQIQDQNEKSNTEQHIADQITKNDSIIELS